MSPGRTSPAARTVQSNLPLGSTIIPFSIATVLLEASISRRIDRPYEKKRGDDRQSEICFVLCITAGSNVQMSNPVTYCSVATLRCGESGLPRGLQVRIRIVHMVFHGMQLPRLVAKAARMARGHGIGMKVGHEQSPARATDAREFAIGGQGVVDVPQHEPTPDHVEKIRRNGKRTHIGDGNARLTAGHEHFATAVNTDGKRSLHSLKPSTRSTSRIQ